jgi:hypothetical protein
LETYPFEIHTTIRKPGSIPQFCNDCTSIGVKPIILDLQAHTGTTVIEDVMTSSRMIGTDSDALCEAARIVEALVGMDHHVVRTKIETVPWHPAAPSRANGKTMPKDRYFESHLAVTLPDSSVDQLRTLARGLKAHISRNVFKRRRNGDVVLMLTLRDPDRDTVAEEFRDYVDYTVMTLRDAGFSVGEVEVEFAIFDSNVDHDAAWIGALNTAH